MTRVEDVARLHYEHDLKEFGETSYSPKWDDLPQGQRRPYLRRAERDIAVHDALRKPKRSAS